MKTWEQKQQQTIRAYLSAKYGAGWALLSAAQQRAAIVEQVAHLLLAQDDEKYAPAIALMERVLSQFEETETLA